jgi:hypothetical protein
VSQAPALIVGGKQFRQSARTRSWARDKQVKRSIEDRFGQGATAAPADEAAKTLLEVQFPIGPLSLESCKERDGKGAKVLASLGSMF